MYRGIGNYITEGPYAPRHLKEPLGEASDAQTAVVLVSAGLVAWWLFFRKDKEGWTRRERKLNARARARQGTK